MSTTRKAYLYRLYPTADQARALHEQLNVAREVYNACLLERREAYRLAGLTLTYYAQANQLKVIRRDCPDLAAVNFSMLQALPRGVPERPAPRPGCGTRQCAGGAPNDPDSCSRRTSTRESPAVPATRSPRRRCSRPSMA